MTGFGVKVTGLNHVMQVMGNIPADKAVGPFLQKLAEETAMYARLYAPQDTGALEGTINVQKISDNHYRVSAPMPYAAYNEWGTRYMEAGKDPNNPLPVVSTSGKHSFRPFMRPAVLRAMRTVDIAVFMDSLLAEMK